MAIEGVELTTAAGGESLTRFPVREGEVTLADRGYANRPGLWWVSQAGGYFIVRLNWQNLPLQHPNGERFDLLAALRGLPEAQVGEFAVRTAPDRRAGIPAIAARMVAIRRSEPAAGQARARIIKERSKKRLARHLDPRTLESAGYVFLLTNHPDLSPVQILEWYRFRWQIELAFKRLKGVLTLDQIAAKDTALARTFLYAKLLTALLLEDFTGCMLAFSPWGLPKPRPPTMLVADATRLAG